MEPQGGGTGGTGYHGFDVAGVVARVLGAVPAVEVLVRRVRGPGESHVPFDAGAAETARPRAERVPVPAAAGPSPGPDVEVVADADDPDRGVGVVGPVLAAWRDLDLVRRPETVQLLAAPGV